MNNNYWTLLLITILINTLSVSAKEYKSGDADIDKIRIEVKKQKTTEANFRERHLMLYMWMGALQHQGADTRSYFHLDMEYWGLEPKINSLKGDGTIN